MQVHHDVIECCDWLLGDQKLSIALTLSFIQTPSCDLPSPMLQEEGLHVKLPWSHFSSLPYLHGRSLQKLCLPFDFLIVFLVLLRLLFLSLFFMIFHMLLIIHDRLCFFLCFMHGNTGGFDLLSNAYNICLDVAVFMWSFILQRKLIFIFSANTL